MRVLVLRDRTEAKLRGDKVVGTSPEAEGVLAACQELVLRGRAGDAAGVAFCAMNP
jgi:hypothetical protein